MILQDKFQAFDWGEEENIKKYNSTHPPQVDLGRATPAQVIYVAPVITATSQDKNHKDDILSPGQWLPGAAWRLQQAGSRAA